MINTIAQSASMTIPIHPATTLVRLDCDSDSESDLSSGIGAILANMNVSESEV